LKKLEKYNIKEFIIYIFFKKIKNAIQILQLKPSEKDSPY
jgi:hypothetical protein